MDMPETAALIIQGGGPTAHGTIPDDMRQYDEFDSMSPEAPSTTGAMEAAEEKPRARRGDAVPQTSDPAEVVVRAAVPVEQSKWGEAQRALHVLFQVGLAKDVGGDRQPKGQRLAGTSESGTTL